MVGDRTQAGRRPSGWLRILGLMVLFTAVLLAVPIAHHFKSRDDAEARLQQVVADTDRLNPGWRIEAVLDAREKVPDAENAAPHVRAVAAILPKGWPNQRAAVAPKPPEEDGAAPIPTPSTETIPERIRAIEPERQLDDKLREELRDEIQALGPVLEAARPIITLSKGRHEVAWSKDWFETLLPHAQEVRTVGELLSLQAAWFAQEGQIDEALRATRGVLNVGRSMGDEPTLISQLVRIALVIRSIQTLERVLAQGEASEAELMETQRLLKSEVDEGPSLMWKAMRAERGAVFETLNRVADGKKSLEGLHGNNHQMTHWDHLTLQLFWRSRIRRSQAAYLEWMNQVVIGAPLPPKEARETFARIESDCNDKKSSSDHTIAVLFMSSFTKVLDAYYRRQAQADCAALAVACERYRMKRGQWPEALDEVAPEFIDRVADDPFGESALRYRRTEDGIVIYSVGSDGKDDHATLDRQHPQRNGADLGVRLWDVKHRRQPAAPPSPVMP